jgi:tripartite-type tricarboxylate transporter receptor subunit TctC
VVENKPGAGGTMGAAALVNATPDGYTLTQLPLGIHRLPLMQTMSFEPVKDLTHIVCLTGYTFGIACTAYAERTFKAEKATIERLGLAKKS